MNLNEKNNVLAAALDDIKYLVTERCGGHPDDIEAQYDCNKAAFDQIAKILANAMRLDVFGDEPPLTGFAKFLSLPELGIQFRRHKSENMTKLIATWRDDANDHVYEISVQRDGDSPNCGWRALATNDRHNVFQLRTKNRHNCEHFALAAMKRYLKRGHRKTYRTIAKAKNAETTKKLHALVRLCNEIIAEPDTAAKNAQIIKDGLLALCEKEEK